MTLKQHARYSFFKLCNEYHEVRKHHLHTEEGKKAFIVLSLQLHIAKGKVPKSYWKYANPLWIDKQ